MKNYSWSEYQLKYSRSYWFSSKTSARIDIFSIMFFAILTAACPFILIHFYAVFAIIPAPFSVLGLFVSMVIPVLLGLMAIDGKFSKIIEWMWYKPLKIYDNRSSRKYKEQLQKIENDKKQERQTKQNRFNAECWVKQLRGNDDV